MTLEVQNNFIKEGISTANYSTTQSFRVPSESYTQIGRSVDQTSYYVTCIEFQMPHDFSAINFKLSCSFLKNLGAWTEQDPSGIEMHITATGRAPGDVYRDLYVNDPGEQGYSQQGTLDSGKTFAQAEDKLTYQILYSTPKLFKANTSYYIYLKRKRSPSPNYNYYLQLDKTKFTIQIEGTPINSNNCYYKTETEWKKVSEIYAKDIDNVWKKVSELYGKTTEAWKSS